MFELIVSVFNPDSRTTLEKPNSETRDSNLGVIIRPLPNMTSIVSIAGPNIFFLELQISYDVISTWLRTYRSKINKAARKTMKQFPPMDRPRTMYLSLLEYVTESWRTVFIRTKADPSPVALSWETTPNGGPGTWNIIEQPGSNSVISGGMGSYPVFSFEINTKRLHRAVLSGEWEVMASRSRFRRDWKVFGFQSGAVFRGQGRMR